MTKSLRFLTYVLCVLFLLGLYSALSPLLTGTAWFGVYYCLSFWSLVIAEAYVSNRGQLPIKSQWAAEDRFLGYLFVAPFIWPVQLYRLLRRNHSTVA